MKSAAKFSSQKSSQKDFPVEKRANEKNKDEKSLRDIYEGDDENYFYIHSHIFR